MLIHLHIITYIDQEAVDGIDRNVNVQETQDNHQLMLFKFDCINDVKKRVMNRLKDIKSRNTAFEEFSADMTSALATISTTSHRKKNENKSTISEKRRSTLSKTTTHAKENTDRWKSICCFGCSYDRYHDEQDV